MADAEFSLSFASQAELRREYEANLRHGRAFIAGAGGVERLAPCTLKLLRADTESALALEAQVVLVSDAEPMRGVALQLSSGPWKEQLAQFVEGDKAEENAATDEMAPQGDPNADAGGEIGDEPAIDKEPAGRGDAEAGSAYTQRRDEIRHMSLSERSRVAHGSNLDDRVLLERIFGSSVWEMLLRSSTLTPPEVAGIARKGSLSIPLIELITDNQNWVRQDIVRRALLTNPRTPPHCIMKVLHATSKAELKLIANSAAAYPNKVRSILNSLKGKRF